MENITENQILDTSLLYPPTYVYEVLESLGQTGRSIYLVYELADLLFPFTYAIMYASTLTYLLQNSVDKEHIIQKVNLIPLIPLLADLLEDIQIIVFLIIYPTELTILTYILPVVTLIKYSTQMIIWLLMLIAFIWFIFRKIKQ